MIQKKCSIVVSVYNEEAVLPHFHNELCSKTQNIGYSIEIIYVNDGSIDTSAAKLDQIADSDNRVKVLHFSRNFGHEAAMTAGIDYASGDVVICMDSDLQNPPELLPDMLQAYEKGNDIVTMMREDREDGGLYKSVFSKMFYRILNHLSEMQLQPNVSDFFLLSKPVADVLRKDYRERTRFMRGFVQTLGFRRTSISYRAPRRAAGESKYSFRKLLRFALSSMASFSKIPLKIGIYSGIMFGLLSVALIIYSIIMWIVNRPVGGYTTLIIFLSAFAAISLIVIGIIGYYIGFILDEVKGRPIYVVERVTTREDER